MCECRKTAKVLVCCVYKVESGLPSYSHTLPGSSQCCKVRKLTAQSVDNHRLLPQTVSGSAFIDSVNLLLINSCGTKLW